MPTPGKLKGFKDAMVRSMLIAAVPNTKEELYMVADALRVWQQHPELRNDVVVKTGVTPDAMLMRIGMVLALLKFGPGQYNEDDVPEDYKPEPAICKWFAPTRVIDCKYCQGRACVRHPLMEEQLAAGKNIEPCECIEQERHEG